MPSRRQFFQHLGNGVVGLFAGAAGATGAVTRWYSSQNASPPPPYDTIDLAPLTVTTPGNIRIHHIQTGFVAVKSAHRSYDGRDGVGFPAIMADSSWTEWMPITAWAIEHPEGVILIDTGEQSAAVTDPTFFNCDPATSFIYNSILRLALTPDLEIAPQLRSLGINPSDVRWVIQTHLHSDHADGLGAFERSEVIINRTDYPTSQGALPCKHPDWLDPTFTVFESVGLAGFERAMPLTDAGDVFILPTPGHSYGHQSVLLVDSSDERQTSYLFAGDTSFDEAQMLAGGTAGIAIDPVASRATLANIRAYAAASPTVYLPSHDSAVRQRLSERQVVNL